MKLLKKCFLLANLLLIAFTLLAYYSPHIDPNKNYIFSVLGLIYPWLFIINLAFIFLWVTTKSKFAFLSLITLILGFSHIKSFVGWSGPVEISSDKKSIQLATLNMANSINLQKKNGTIIEENKNNFVYYFIEDIRADIICTQETSRLGNEVFINFIKYPFQYTLKNNSNSIYSKYPIVNTGEITFDLFGTACAWADIQIGETLLRVYNLHLFSNLVSADSEKVLKNADFQDKKTWLGLRGMFAKYKNATAIRAKQSNIILEHVKQCKHPSIICGDLNDTPQSFVYANLSKDRNDTFTICGSGLGTTYSGIIPALRIDYILPDKRLKVINHKIHKVNYSDHYPISAKIRLP